MVGRKRRAAKMPQRLRAQGALLRADAQQRGRAVADRFDRRRIESIEHEHIGRTFAQELRQRPYIPMGGDIAMGCAHAHSLRRVDDRQRGGLEITGFESACDDGQPQSDASLRDVCALQALEREHAIAMPREVLRGPLLVAECVQEAHARFRNVARNADDVARIRQLGAQQFDLRATQRECVVRCDRGDRAHRVVAKLAHDPRFKPALVVEAQRPLPLRRSWLCVPLREINPSVGSDALAKQQRLSTVRCHVRLEVSEPAQQPAMVAVGMLVPEVRHALPTDPRTVIDDQCVGHRSMARVK